jgi:hypothetical protein
VDKSWSKKTATEIAAAPLEALKGISPTRAAALTRALGVHTVAELAGSRYIAAAQAITAAANASH